ncbi:MAG: DUF6206 family protein [Acidimicrobiia bacterium]|jgi:hypothetical protein
MTTLDGALAALEEEVQRALRTGDESHLAVLGYGEVGSVLRLDAPGGPYAAKRLPPFRRQSGLDRYRHVFATYKAHLDAAGVRLAPTEVRALPTRRGGRTAYAIQPIYPPERLAPAYLRTCDIPTGRVLTDRLVDAVMRVASPQVGFDAQLANWVVDDDGELRYLDLTTPLLRDERGREQLDVGVFVRSLPWGVRSVARLVVPRLVLHHFYRPRGILLDVTANLHKERLAQWIPIFVAAAHRRLEHPFTSRHVDLYYRAISLMWELVQRARRLDRVWQLRVRRRPYRFLLPHPIQR